MSILDKKIAALNAAKKDLLNEYMLIPFTDMDIKWKAYTQIADYLPVHHFIYHFKNLSDEIYRRQDGYVFEFDRYTEVSFGYLLELLEESFYEQLEEDTFDFSETPTLVDFYRRANISLPEEGDTKEYKEALIEAFEKQLLALTQEILNSGYRGFTYDW